MANATTGQAKRDHAEIARAFEEDVLTDRFPCGSLFRAAIERQRRDLARTDWEYRWTPDLGAKACRFFELLPYAEGPKRGDNFQLEPWEVWVVFVLFGWMDGMGFRRFRMASIWLPKGNGKSPLAAGIVAYVLATSREGPKCYSAATMRKQARLVFEHAQEMFRLRPEICRKFGLDPEEHRIRGVGDNRVYEPISAEAGSIEGVRPSVVVLDEVHVLPNRKLFDNLKSACTKVDGSLFLLISTAGFDCAPEAIGWLQFSRARKILQDETQDPTTFALIAAADEGMDPWSEKTWRVANPNLGVSVSLTGLRAEAQVAKEMPSEQPSFFTKHLNWWVQAANRWMDMAKWDACADPALQRNDFEGERCIVGLDLATRRDFSAKVLLFPEERDDGLHLTAFADFWLHETGVKALDTILRPLVHATPGEVTNLDTVTQSVIDDAPLFQIAEVAFDPYFADMLGQDLQEAGLAVTEIQQQVSNLSPAMRMIEAAVYSGRFHHDGNPLLRYCMANVVARVDNNDRIFPQRDNTGSRRPIDGASALFNAAARAMAIPDDPYSDGHGFVVLGGGPNGAD